MNTINWTKISVIKFDMHLESRYGDIVIYRKEYNKKILYSILRVIYRPFVTKHIFMLCIFYVWPRNIPFKFHSLPCWMKTRTFRRNLVKHLSRKMFKNTTYFRVEMHIINVLTNYLYLCNNTKFPFKYYRYYVD